jgi:hypothetical protein
MRIKYTLSALAVVAGGLLAGTAAARVNMNVPPTVGHAFIPTLAGDFYVHDNTVCGNVYASRTWATPLVVDPNDSGVYAYQYVQHGSPNGVISAMFSFRPNGTVYSWSRSYTSNTYLGYVYVPDNGTAFIRSDVAKGLNGQPADCLFNFRVHGF